jgi:uncharacterized protein YjbI with pentapeptide repeats
VDATIEWNSEKEKIFIQGNLQITELKSLLQQFFKQQENSFIKEIYKKRIDLTARQFFKLDDYYFSLQWVFEEESKHIMLEDIHILDELIVDNNNVVVTNQYYIGKELPESKTFDDVIDSIIESKTVRKLFLHTVKIAKLNFINSDFEIVHILGSHIEDVNIHSSDFTEFKIDFVSFRNFSIFNSKIENTFHLEEISIFSEMKIENIKTKELKINGDNHLVDIKNIVIQDTEIHYKQLFYPMHTDIQKVYINNLLVNKKLYIRLSKQNKLIIDSLQILNTTFQKDSKLHLKNLTIKNFTLSDITQEWSEAIFENIVVTESLKLESIDFQKAKFVNCNFSECDIEIADSVSFKDTLFNSIKWGDTSRITASRDTFRQLKFVNDSQGNIIEANRFHAEEMKAYKKEMEENPDKHSFEDKLIFWLSENISNFSQSWILPIFWFFVVTMGFLIGIEIDQTSQFFSNSEKVVGLILFAVISIVGFKNRYTEPVEIVSILFGLTSFYYFQIYELSTNDLAKFTNPKFDKDSFKGYEAVWFIHKAILSVLIYHLTIALRRQTKR